MVQKLRHYRTGRLRLALIYALTLWVASIASVLGQEYHLKQRSIGVKNGLSSRSYKTFFMDSDGLMWMSGDYGVDLYDGHRVKNFFVNTMDIPLLSIDQLAEDANGDIWFAGTSNDGSRSFDLIVLNKKTGVTQTIDQAFSKLPFEITDVKYIASNPGKQGIWVFTNSAIYVTDTSGQFKKLSEVGIDILGITMMDSGVWVHSKRLWLNIDSNGRTVQQIDIDPAKSFRVIGTDSGANIYYYNLELEGVFRPEIYRNGALWHSGSWSQRQFFGVDPIQNHIWSQNFETGSIEVMDLDLNILFQDDNAIAYQNPMHFFFDHLGNAWRVFDEKVYMLKLEEILFQNYLTDVLVFGEYGFGSRGLHFANDSTLLASGLAGTHVVNIKSGEAKGLETPTQAEFLAPSQIFTLRRLAIEEAPDGLLWLSNEGERIFSYDLENGYGKLITSNAETIDPATGAPMERLDFNWSLHFDRDGGALIGQINGMSYLPKDANQYQDFQHYNEFSELKHSGVIDFYENDYGTWIASTTGLYLRDEAKGIIDRFHTRGKEGKKIPFNNLTQVTSGENGRLWIASKGGGIFSLDVETGEYQQWTTSEGLSHNVTYAVYPDKYGKVWIPTNKGITRLDPKTGETNIFLEQDGLSHEEFNTISHTSAPDGRLAFGNLNGITVFNPKDFEDSPTSTATLLTTNVSIQSGKDGRFYNTTTQLDQSNTITIKPSDISFVLEFTMLDYINTNINLFAYKLEGLDNDWTFIDRPEVRLNRLPYGQHTLMLRGQGVNGIWANTKTIKIAVPRPIYLTWWFFCIVGFVLIMGVIIVLKYRERSLLTRQRELEIEIDKRTEKIRKQAEELKSLDRLKSKFFANISHELRTPLSLVLAPINKVLGAGQMDNQIKGDLLLAKRNTESVEKLVNEILDLNRLESGVAQPRYSVVDLNTFFQRIFVNFQSRALAQKLNYSLKSEIPEGFKWVLDPVMTEKIINNLISNAFKHTVESGSVELFLYNGQNLHFEVKDTGSGISSEDLPYVFDRFFQTKDPNKKAEGGTGIGLALSKELAVAMQGNIQVESTLNVGSRFELVLPSRNTPKDSPTEIKTAESTEIPVLPNVGGKLLLVEDHDDMRSFVSTNLQNQFMIDTANNGKEALEYLKNSNEKPKLIITDMMMPIMDGLELLDHLKNNVDTKDIPVILLTARSAEKDKLEAFRLGVDDYLLKPFSLDELKARIINLLKTAELKRVANLVTDVTKDSVAVNNATEEWLLNVKRLTEQHVSDVDFNIGSIATKLGSSERNFHRKLKKATGYTPSIYLKEIRLQMARNFLENATYQQPSEVAQAVGFTSTKYFFRLYKTRFGKSPSAYYV